MSKENRFDETYESWRKIRYNKIVKYYGETFFIGKSLLELGCGDGDFGNMFYELGSEVTCVDAREEHITHLQTLYPHLISYVFDLNKGLGTDKKFDIILNTGLLYHLSKYKHNIRSCCNQCTHLILETEVCDSNNPHMAILILEKNGFDQSYTGWGIRPSPAAIERCLTENNFSFQREFNDLNCNPHVYDWESKNDNSYRDGLRAFWFCRRK